MATGSGPRDGIHFSDFLDSSPPTRVLTWWNDVGRTRAGSAHVHPSAASHTEGFVIVLWTALCKERMFFLLLQMLTGA